MTLGPGPSAVALERSGPALAGRVWSTSGLVTSGSPGLLGWAFAALPVLALLGGAGFLWPLIGPVCLLGLLDARDGRLPGGGVVLVAFVGWAGLTSLPLVTEGLGPVLLGAYRWLVLVSLVGVFLHVANRLDRQAAVRIVSTIMVALWCCLVGFGVLSFAAPFLSVTTPVQALLPQAFLANSYLADLTVFRLSEVQVVLGEVTTRPSAPFAYANGWGSAFVLVTPMTAAWLVAGRRGSRRVFGLALMAIGCIVAIASLNRGVWLLLVVMALYLGLRSRHRVRLFAAALPLVVVLTVGVLALTPLGDRVEQRLAVADESDRTRTSIVTESVAAVLDAPLVGYGAPVERQVGVPIGTHGFAWYLMIAHGLVGFALFTCWLVVAVATGFRAVGPVGQAAHLTLLVALIQMPIYGLLPQLPLVGAAAAVCLHLRPRAGGPAVAFPGSPR